eukprot:GHVU01106688.1.p1 GENE.GHVU01106688.1~~GHVU01106688.1.p1  ORF type:complete len:102 (-),score=1.98 GHVU01106688.1:350-655(-)
MCARGLLPYTQLRPSPIPNSFAGADVLEVWASAKALLDMPWLTPGQVLSPRGIPRRVRYADVVRAVIHRSNRSLLGVFPAPRLSSGPEALASTLSAQVVGR